MAGFSSRSDQLWHFALQLAEDEIKSIPFAQQEEHGQRIQTKYNQLVSNLSCVGDIIGVMYEKKKLTPKELEQIQHLQSTPIRANEELLSIIARKPRDVYECFLTLIKKTNQLHLYQMLVSGEDTCDKAKRGDVSNHKDLIHRNFMLISDKLDTESGLISMLHQQGVLTVREKEHIFCINDTFQKNEILLGLLSKKSPNDFEKFLKALEASGQSHLAKELRKPEDSDADLATDPSAVQTPKSIGHKLIPKGLDESGQKPVPVRSFSKPVLPPKTLLKPGRKLNPSHSSSKPVPPPQSTLAQHDAKLMDTVAKPIEKTANFRRTKGVLFQSRLKGLESHLQRDIAIKVTYASLVLLDKPEDCLQICFHLLLQECHQMRTEIFARNDETNKELEQLRKNASQHSAAATLNEVYRTQLNSTQQELTSERFQNNEKRMQLEEKIDKLKTDMDNEKAKCKRFEEKLLDNTVIVEIEDRLKKAECDKQFFQKQVHDVSARLASTEYELQKTKEIVEESTTEIILLRTESENLKKAGEVLRKENEIKNNLEVQLLHTQEHCRNLQAQLKEKEMCLEEERSLEKESSFKFADEENLELIKPQKDAVEENSLENNRILKLQEELDSEKRRRQTLEDLLRNATAQLEQLSRKLEVRDITFVTQESHVIIRNHQFLVENIKSDRLIDLLHEKMFITDEKRDHLNKQPVSFYRNDALLQWMRTISFKQDKGQMVLECFCQTKQNFFADLLGKGGVLIKSKISTNKSSGNDLEGLKEKEAVIIDSLNQLQGLSLSSIQNASSEIADADIVIAPYCRKEVDGIVVWFWCQSKYGEINLQILYESGILLEKLATIFKEVSNDKVSSASKLLVPTSLTIFEHDFETTYELTQHVMVPTETHEHTLDDIITRDDNLLTMKLTKRDFCIKELVETEKNYIQMLKIIIDCFIKRLRPKIPASDCDTIFMGIENLYYIHQGFYADLLRACNPRSTSNYGGMGHVTIADCFIKWKEKFLDYGKFCCNLPRVQMTLDRLMQTKSMQQLIMECQREANDGNLRLRDLLSVPMQRVLKYHLLLKELIKNTDQMHPHRKCLERGLEEMQDLSGYLSEVKRDNETLDMMEESERSITDLVMNDNTHFRDYGRLIKVGELRVRRPNEKKDRERSIFLFDMVVVICKSRGETYNYKDALILFQHVLNDINAKEKNKYPFHLVHKETRETWTFIAKTQELRAKWIEAINLANDNYCPPFAITDRHEFRMASFRDPTICDVCRKLLRGIFFQGYKCQRTNMVVHKACIEKAKDIGGPPVISPKMELPTPSTPVPIVSAQFNKGIGPGDYLNLSGDTEVPSATHQDY